MVPLESVPTCIPQTHSRVELCPSVCDRQLIYNQRSWPHEEHFLSSTPGRALQSHAHLSQVVTELLATN